MPPTVTTWVSRSLRELRSGSSSADPTSCAIEQSVAAAMTCSTPSSGWSDTYSPSISRSKASSVDFSHSPSGTGTSNVTSSWLSSPKSESWPMASFRFTSMIASTACSWISTSPRRGCPNESNAPALTSDSITRLLQTLTGTLRRKSEKLPKAPLAVRAATTDSTTAVPTLRTAARPNLMSGPTAVKMAFDALTSGGRTLMPILRHSFRYSADLSLSPATEVSRPAMYSAGKFALRYAVQYATS